MTTAQDVYREYEAQRLLSLVALSPSPHHQGLELATELRAQHRQRQQPRPSSSRISRISSISSSNAHPPPSSPRRGGGRVRRGPGRHVAQAIIAGPWADRVGTEGGSTAQPASSPAAWESTQAFRPPSSSIHRRPAYVAHRLVTAHADPLHEAFQQLSAIPSSHTDRQHQLRRRRRPRTAASPRSAAGQARAAGSAAAAAAPGARSPRQKVGAARRPLSAPAAGHSSAAAAASRAPVVRPPSARLAVQDPTSVLGPRAISRQHTVAERPIVRAHCASTTIPTAAARQECHSYPVSSSAAPPCGGGGGGALDAAPLADMQAIDMLALPRNTRPQMVGYGIHLRWARPQTERGPRRSHPPVSLWSLVEAGALA
jgi:hypothetical protein